MDLQSSSLFQSTLGKDSCATSGPLRRGNQSLDFQFSQIRGDTAAAESQLKNFAAHFFFRDVIERKSGLGAKKFRRKLENECQPVDDVEDEEQDGKGDEEELVDAPVLLRQLPRVQRRVGRRLSLVHLVLEVVLANDLGAHPVGGRHVPLLLEQDGRVPEISFESLLKSDFGQIQLNRQFFDLNYICTQFEGM